MSFTSLHYAFFLICTTIIYYALPHRFRWVLLLGASYYFYTSYRIEFGVILFLSTTFNYTLARLISQRRDSARKKLLYFCITVNTLTLVYFKYRLFLLS